MIFRNQGKGAMYLEKEDKYRNINTQKNLHEITK